MVLKSRDTFIKLTLKRPFQVIDKYSLNADP